MGFPHWLDLRIILLKSIESYGEFHGGPVVTTLHGGGHGDPLQYSCLGNPMDGGLGGLPFIGLQRVRHDLATRTRGIVARAFSLCRVKGSHLEDRKRAPWSWTSQPPELFAVLFKSPSLWYFLKQPELRHCLVFSWDISSPDPSL